MVLWSKFHGGALWGLHCEHHVWEAFAQPVWKPWGGTPPPRSPRGTLSSSDSKGKKPASASPGTTLGGSSKKSHMGSLSTPPSSSTKPSSELPPPPPLNDERVSLSSTLAHHQIACIPFNLWR
ncbi:UNVERIFIED_CONTAM: hypothetical protein Slati_3093000 [Sesamum latifolium]|uniref:Uncharacterized protein n=1 Tax=Sesamum latifolium TaxID=2727402 RepID=A0AAW2UZZ6_9LAMI